MSEYIFHGVKFLDFERLYQILETGYILPRCMMNENKPDDLNNLFNGTEYISLSMPSQGTPRLARVFKSAYDRYIFGNLCFVMDNVPNLVYPMLMYEEEKEVVKEALGDYISKLEDELRGR